jgi:chemotaxis protein methyltransferase WspC
MTHTAVRRWLEEHTPIEPSLLDGAGIEMLIAERVTSLGGREQAYVTELGRSPEEVDRLLAAVAVPETWLFRYPRSYDLLLEFLQRRLASGATSLRMLSIGCATGQEPYCMAMTALHAGWPADRVHVEGVDRNQEFLRAAAIAKYGAASIRTEIPPWAVGFLHRSGDTVAIDPAVRALVRFRRADVTDRAALSGAGPFDVIFCRNLLIYLNAAAREGLLGSICDEIAPGGLLFVGHAEHFIHGKGPFRAVNAPHAFAMEAVGAEAGVSVRPPAVDRMAAVVSAPPPRAVVRATESPRPTVRIETEHPTEGTIEDARALADSGRAEEAEAMIRGIIARGGPSAPAMELQGMIRMSVNDVDGAKRLFEQAVYMEPARSASLLQLAIISERSGAARRAASYWDRAQRGSADHSEERRR